MRAAFELRELFYDLSKIKETAHTKTLCAYPQPRWRQEPCKRSTYYRNPFHSLYIVTSTDLVDMKNLVLGCSIPS